MRLRAIAFALAAFAAVGAGAWHIGKAAVDYLEDRTRSDLAASLQAAGEDWAAIRVNGLAVTLAGDAPDELSRFRAIEVARQTVDSARLHDRMRVAAATPLGRPDFAVELLRNGVDVSLIGLVPAHGAREAIAAGLSAAGIGATVTDMLETADHPAPDDWHPALAFALQAIAGLPRAKVQVAPGSVTITAVAEDEAARAALARELAAAAPDELALDLDLTAPRPVIAPFTVAFRRAPDGTPSLLACSAESEADAEIILAAARAAGLADADCRLGLGAPSPDWAAAAARGIAAVAEMGGGSFALTDLDAVLSGPPGLDPRRLAATGAALAADLPLVFSLATRGAARITTEEGEGVVYAPEFHATLEDGSLSLVGPLADRTAQTAIVGFAEALFGHASVDHTTVLDPNLPEGWPGRILAGIEALAQLEDGSLSVTPDAITVSGRAIEEDAGRELEAFFAAKGAEHVVIDVAFDAEAAAIAAAADRPADEVCADELAAILADEMILFETGSAKIDAESADVIAAIAAALEACPGARFEVSGHTDSRGRADVNQRLSEARAAAVAGAVAEHGPLLVDLEAIGYGPDRPIADNASAEGRALNRRIEFALLEEAEADLAEAPDDLAPTAAGKAEAERAAEAGDDPD